MLLNDQLLNFAPLVWNCLHALSELHATSNAYFRYLWSFVFWRTRENTEAKVYKSHATGSEEESKLLNFVQRFPDELGTIMLKN